MGSNSEFTGGPYPNVDQVITFVPGEKKLIEVYGYEPDGEVKASYEGQTFRKFRFASTYVQTYTHGGELQFVDSNGEYPSSNTSKKTIMRYTKGREASLKGDYNTWYKQ